MLSHISYTGIVRRTTRPNPAAEIARLKDHPLARLKSLTLKLRWSEETGTWVVQIPELFNLGTSGRTPEEALDEAKSLLRAYLKSCEELHTKLPLSRADLREIWAAIAA